MIYPLISAPPQSSAPAERAPQNAVEAAIQFEALLLHQMLQAARDSETHEDQAGETMWDLAAQHLSKVMADSGGLGLSRLVIQGLGEPATEHPSADPPEPVRRQDSVGLGTWGYERLSPATAPITRC